MSERKPRSNAILLNLPHDQQDQLASWLLDDGMSYRIAVKQVKAEFGVDCSTNGMGEFWRQVCAPRRLRRAASAASGLPALAQTMDVDWQGTSMQLLEQKVFELLANPETDVRATFALGTLVDKLKTRTLREKELDAKIIGSQQKHEQKDREIAQRERQIVLEREKFDSQERKNAEAKARLNQVVQSKGGVTSETIQQIEEAMKLL